MNTIALVGRLTKDVELKAQGDTQVANFTLAVARPYKSDETDFIRCVAWGKSAEIISQYAGTQGTQLAVRGRLEISSYEKDVNGTSVTMWTSQVVVEQQTFIGNKNDSQSQQQGQQGQFQNQQGYQAPQQDFGQQQQQPFQGQQQAPQQPQQDFGQQGFGQQQMQQQAPQQQQPFQGQQQQQPFQGQQMQQQAPQQDFGQQQNQGFPAPQQQPNPFGNAVGDDDLPF